MICLLAKNCCCQKSKVRIKVIRARPNSYMLSDNPNSSLKIVDYSLFKRRILVFEPNLQNLQWNLEREPAQYKHMKTIARTFIIPSCQNQFIQENKIDNAPVRRIAVAMNIISAVAGCFQENPFSYQQFHLRELENIRCGRATFFRYNFSLSSLIYNNESNAV